MRDKTIYWLATAPLKAARRRARAFTSSGSGGGGSAGRPTPGDRCRNAMSGVDCGGHGGACISAADWEQSVRLGVLRRTGFVRRNRFLVLVLRAPKSCAWGSGSAAHGQFSLRAVVTGHRQGSLSSSQCTSTGA